VSFLRPPLDTYREAEESQGGGALSTVSQYLYGSDKWKSGIKNKTSIYFDNTYQLLKY
jgi:hypothetical protein